jgi:adenosine deaminase
VTGRSTLEFIRDLPKVELHLHLETSLRLRRLAERQHHPEGDPPDSGVRVPAEGGGSGVANPEKFKGYDRLRRLRYLSRAGKIPDSSYSSDNIEQITSELLAEAAAQRVRYVEVRVGGRRGFSLLGTRRMLEAMARARGRAEREQGIRSGFLVTLVRERGPKEAEQRVREAIACRDCGVVGVDLAGDEQNYPPALFARAMDLAREAGLGITVHAGEFAGPASIWTAVYQLGARRLGHGIRAAEDPELLHRLRESGVTLELCPTSNVRLGLCESMEALPIRQLMAAGVSVTVNSDDPVLLGTDISRELEIVASTFAFTSDEVRALVDTASRAAFSVPPGLP